MHLLEYSAFIIFYSPLIKEKILLLRCWSMPRLPLAVLYCLVLHIPHTLNHHTKEHQELISRISSNLSSPGKGHSWLMMHVRYQYCIIRNTDSIRIWLKGTKIERSSSTLFLLSCTQASSSSTYECQHKVCNQKLCIYMGIKSNYDCIRCPFEKLLCKRESANSTD